MRERVRDRLGNGFFRGCVWLLALYGQSFAEVPPIPTQPSSAPASADSVEIQQLVRLLGHPLPARRAAAARQLAAWGPLAEAELIRAQAGPETEIAVAAGELLAQIQNIPLLGAQLKLRATPARIAWNQMVTLEVHIHNPLAAPIRIPPTAHRTLPASRPTSDEDRPAMQVASLLDVADLLQVLDPEGRPLDLRFETLQDDPEVLRAVDRRASDTLKWAMLPAGADAVIVVEQFNRGWMRYPLLGVGKHRVTLNWQPAWKNPQWIQAGLGRIGAEPLDIEIVTAAPTRVRQASRPLELALRWDRGKYIVSVRCIWDVPVWVNLNCNEHSAAHARLRWQIAQDEGADPLVWEPDGTGAFTLNRILRIEPGQEMKLAEIESATLRTHLPSTRPADKPLDLTIVYTQIAGVEAIRNDLRAADRSAAQLPPHLFTGTLRASLDEP